MIIGSLDGKINSLYLFPCGLRMCKYPNLRDLIAPSDIWTHTMALASTGLVTSEEKRQPSNFLQMGQRDSFETLVQLCLPGIY